MPIVITVILAAASLILPAGVGCAELPTKKVLTLEIGRKIVAAAEAEAAQKHIAGVVAVVDDEGWVILIERMDHSAYLASVELAPGKARTAALFKKPSEDLEDAINRGRFADVTAPGLVQMKGGLPIIIDGDVVGGVGASFDTPEHDIQIAQAGLKALDH